MRIAVCLSGQPRFLDRTSSLMIENLINTNRAEVFLHTWDVTEKDGPIKFGGDGGWKDYRISEGSAQKAVKIFKPISYMIEDPKQFHDPSISAEKTFEVWMNGWEKEAKEAGEDVTSYSRRIVNSWFSMWYSIMQSNLLCQKYALLNNFKYDAIIRCRFDLLVEQPLFVSNLDMSYLYYPVIGQPPPLVSDWLNIGSTENMSVLASTFFQIRKIYNQIALANSTGFCNELALAATIARSDITAVGLPMHVSLVRL